MTSSELPPDIDAPPADEQEVPAPVPPVPASGGTGEWKPPTPEELGRMLPNYRVDALLGRGGMGAVYKCWQPSLDRPVAIKLLPAEFAVDERFVARFQREARTLARLQHPRIVTIHDFGQTSGGNLYFVMEYIDGTDLRRLMRGPGLDVEQALAVVGQLCDALQAAHREGIVHRDIKPENVLITSDGYVKLADFGLAQPPREDGMTVLTGTNVIMGTPCYMAPEQHVSGGPADPRSDLFALGIMLYEMLTGRRPQGVFDPPSHKVMVDVRIDGIVLKALQSEPERRYQSALDLKSAVEEIRNTPPPTAATAAVRVPIASRRPARWPRYAVAACFLALLGIIAYLMLNRSSGRPPVVAVATEAPVSTASAPTPSLKPATPVQIASIPQPPPKAAATPATPTPATPMPAAVVARLATPAPLAAATPEPPAAPAVPASLQDALLKYAWEWTYASNPPDILIFHPDYVATCERFSWHWKITGPRTAVAYNATQGTKQLPTFSATLSFNENWSTLVASTSDGRTTYTGRRLALHSTPPGPGSSAPSVVLAGGEISLFNGRDLTGWAGLQNIWSVRDGAITGQITARNNPHTNTFLVWQGGPLSDFEFSCKYKLIPENADAKANSGIQFRAYMTDAGKFGLKGYQGEMDPGKNHPPSWPAMASINGCLTDDPPGNVIAATGQKVRPGAGVSSLGTDEPAAKSYRPTDWNDYKIIAEGNHIQIFVNGLQTVDAIDAANRYTSGLLGFQMHSYGPSAEKTIQFKDIRLKRLGAQARTAP